MNRAERFESRRGKERVSFLLFRIGIKVVCNALTQSITDMSLRFMCMYLCLTSLPQSACMQAANQQHKSRFALSKCSCRKIYKTTTIIIKMHQDSKKKKVGINLSIAVYAA